MITNVLYLNLHIITLAPWLSATYKVELYMLEGGHFKNNTSIIIMSQTFDLSCSDVIIQMFLPYLEAFHNVFFEKQVLHLYIRPFPILFRWHQAPCCPPTQPLHCLCQDNFLQIKKFSEKIDCRILSRHIKMST